MTNRTDLAVIVASRVKAEIFRLHFGLRRPELHLREIVRQSGLSLGTVQQELKGLTAVGLLQSHRDGNRVYFSANPDHPAHRELSALVLKTDGLAEVPGKALTAPEVQLAFVFGSLARGETHAGSDVDLMVIGSLGLRGLTKLLSGAAEVVGREINPHLLTPEEFRERKRNGDHFVTSVLAAPMLFVKGTEHELAAMGQQRLAESPSDQPERNSGPAQDRRAGPRGGHRGRPRPASTRSAPQMVDDVMNRFGFERVQTAMRALGWTDHNETESPSHETLRATARRLLDTVAEEREAFVEHQSGGFRACRYPPGTVTLTFVGESGCSRNTPGARLPDRTAGRWIGISYWILSPAEVRVAQRSELRIIALGDSPVKTD